ncbi:hypothetical protein K0M31_009491 [Melipona bicolor]|uniref:Uncharacterized protein n=1 Tax=Melipona bicolor TaxID=60889 RepID=A0AA40KJ27_9HYME|nr:hypothetical protein K0M31_009491 [Melipona bicolor]
MQFERVAKETESGNGWKEKDRVFQQKITRNATYENETIVPNLPAWNSSIVADDDETAENVPSTEREKDLEAASSLRLSSGARLVAFACWPGSSATKSQRETLCGSGFADRMVFSNKVRFPGFEAPEKEAAPDFVGVAKITAPGIGRSGRTRPATCKWPRLSSPSLVYRRRCERLVPRLQGSLGKRGTAVGERLEWSPRWSRGCGSKRRSTRLNDKKTTARGIVGRSMVHSAELKSSRTSSRRV